MQIEDLPFKLTDLKPQKTRFVISGHRDKTGELIPLYFKPFSLNAEIWMSDRWTPPAIHMIFEEVKMRELSELAHFLLEDKSDIRTVEEFREMVLGNDDKVELLRALMEAIGISRPLQEKIEKASEKKSLPNRQTRRKKTPNKKR